MQLTSHAACLCSSIFCCTTVIHVAYVTCCMPMLFHYLLHHCDPQCALFSYFCVWSIKPLCNGTAPMLVSLGSTMCTLQGTCSSTACHKLLHSVHFSWWALLLGHRLFLRVERQAFVCLPNTQALLFTIHTFVRRLEEVGVCVYVCPTSLSICTFPSALDLKRIIGVVLWIIRINSTSTKSCLCSNGPQQAIASCN